MTREEKIAQVMVMLEDDAVFLEILRTLVKDAVPGIPCEKLDEILAATDGTV